MKTDKTISKEYEKTISQLGHIPVIIKRLISELDTKSIYYEKNKKDLEKVYRITNRAFSDTLSYEVIY